MLASYGEIMMSIRIVLALSALAIGAAPRAQAQSVADFFHGKTINLSIGYTSGGGYDLNARVLAKHMGRHIPGNPTVVPQNMPGAGRLRLRDILFTRGAQ